MWMQGPKSSYYTFFFFPIKDKIGFFFQNKNIKKNLLNPLLTWLEEWQLAYESISCFLNYF